MATVGRFAGFRFTIYPNDHRPAHVHVIGAGCVAIFDLHCPNGPPELRENYDCKPADLRLIRAALTKLVAKFCTAWESIHGSV